MKRLLLLYSILFYTTLHIFAQDTILLGSQPIVSKCDYILYDAGGSTGVYQNNVNETITLYSNDPNKGSVMVEVVSMDIDSTDTLYFYDGISANAPLLHKMNNNNYDPTGTFRYAATIQNTSGAITVQFKSDSAATGAGFAIHVTCMAPCQRVNVRFDTILSSHVPHLNPDDGYLYLDVCPYDTTHLVVYCDYPDNYYSYVQSDLNTKFTWDLGTTTIDSVGLHDLNYYFTPGRGYDVAISAVDTHHCVSLTPVTFRVRTSKNPIRNLSPLNPVCVGQEIDLSVGYDNLSSLQLDSVGSEQLTALKVVDTVFLPDGISCQPYGTSYRSYVNFTSFAPNDSIKSADDILFVRILMEHSAIEDIRISLICPNQKTCKIQPDYQNDGWGGISHNFRTNLGVANRLQDVNSCNPSQNPPGIAWNYVWSNNSTLGYQYAPGTYGYCYEPVNVQFTPNPMWDNSSGQGMSSYKIDSSDVTNMSQIYHPKESFSNLIGCPLNGNWCIEVQDLWTNDNGYIYEWEMALDPILLPQNWSYTVQVDTTFINGPGSNGMIINPPTSGTINYNVSVVDEFGCRFDTITPLLVVPTPMPKLGPDTSLCEGSILHLTAEFDNPNTTYHWNTGNRTESIDVVTEGQYIVNIVAYNDTAHIQCKGSDTINVKVNPVPLTDFTIADTVGCAPQEIKINNQTLDDGINCNYEWLVLHSNGLLAASSNLRDPTFSLDDPDIYSIFLRASTPEGCKDSLYRWGYVHVYDQPLAEFEATPQESLFGESQGIVFFHNFADSTSILQNSTTWKWDFGDGETDTENFSPTHTFASWGDYDVTLFITNAHGCSSEIAHTVVIEDDLIFPNVITPNGDNKNDVFAIQNLNTDINFEDPDGYRTNDLYISDRWGKVVYHVKNYDTYAKNGEIFKGSQVFDATGLPDGTYYYSFYYKGKVKIVDYHGSLTVIR